MRDGRILKQKKRKRQIRFTNHYYSVGLALCNRSWPECNGNFLRVKPTILPGCTICKTC